jgi:hypothetical protein
LEEKAMKVKTSVITISFTIDEAMALKTILGKMSRNDYSEKFRLGEVAKAAVDPLYALFCEALYGGDDDRNS